MYQPKGKYVSIDVNHPQALGYCDYTQIIHMRKDLIRQMEWRGDALVWTGFYVGRDFLDTPNEQLRPPILPPDPVPILEPRGPQGNLPYLPEGIPAFPENERARILQNFNWRNPGFVIPPSNANSVDGIPALPENLRLQQLQEFHWSN